MTATRLEPTTTYLVYEQSTICPDWQIGWAELWVLICSVHFIIFSYHAMDTFQSYSTLYICLNVKEFFARNKHDIWSLSNCNETRTHNHLVCKRTLNHLAKLTEWLSLTVSTNLYCAFECILLSCHVPISDLLHTLYLLRCQGTLCSKQARHLKFEWLQWGSNPQPLSL